MPASPASPVNPPSPVFPANEIACRLEARGAWLSIFDSAGIEDAEAGGVAESGDGDGNRQSGSVEHLADSQEGTGMPLVSQGAGDRQHQKRQIVGKGSCGV